MKEQLWRIWAFACDCPKACDNTNIAQESEQKGKMETMLDLCVRRMCDDVYRATI